LAWFYGGAALLRLGHAPEAGAFFRQAAARGYDSPLLEEMLGDAAYNTGDFAAAAARYGRALSRAPRERGLRSKLGLAQVRAGRHREGLAQLRAAAAETPEHPENAHRLQLAEEFLAATKAAASHADNLPEWRDRRQEPGAIHRMY
jgi:predicted Zn-dependent protease